MEGLGTCESHAIAIEVTVCIFQGVSEPVLFLRYAER